MKISKELYDELCELKNAYLNSDGHEVNNPKPLVMDTGLNRPPTLQEQIKRVMKTELSRQAMEQQMETFQEANDFDVSDDFEVEVKGKYELVEEEFIETAPNIKPVVTEKQQAEQKVEEDANPVQTEDESPPVAEEIPK